MGGKGELSIYWRGEHEGRLGLKTGTMVWDVLNLRCL